MAISVVTAPISGATGYTLACGSSANRVAVAFTETNPSGSPSAPTIGGVSMTQTGSNSNRGTGSLGSMWYLVAPGTGNQTVAYGGNDIACISMVFDGVDQSTPIDTSTVVNSGTQTMNFTVTVANANSAAFAATDSSVGNSITPSNILTTKGLAAFAALSAYGLSVGTGSQTGTLTWDIACTTFGNMIILKPVAVASANGNFLAFM